MSKLFQNKVESYTKVLLLQKLLYEMYFLKLLYVIGLVKFKNLFHKSIVDRDRKIGLLQSIDQIG